MKDSQLILLNAKKTVGDNIRKYRVMEGLTQEDLAKRIGTKNRLGQTVSRRSMSDIERGVQNTSLDILAEIAYELRIPLSYLFEGANFERGDTLYSKLEQEYQMLQRKHDALVDKLQDLAKRFS